MDKVTDVKDGDNSRRETGFNLFVPSFAGGEGVLVVFSFVVWVQRGVRSGDRGLVSTPKRTLRSERREREDVG